ncbi:MAG: 3-oxoacyl-[acyl-carrier-protein] reductase [Chitinivibrionales bacterium]|nr:3-oxoacyl-[acyl-carrier-protein] reductase [Chitinivibrionales bacterium]
MSKHIIITGGARGIGRAIVEQLCREGHTVVFNYKSNKDAAAELVERIEAEGPGQAIALQCDVADFDSAGAFVSQAKAALHEDVDVLINNAGITRDKSMFIMSRDEWEEVIDTNLNGCFNITRHLIVYFMKNKKGKIINISSVSGINGVAGQTNYCASKAGIIGFTKALARETAKLGIPVNCVAPGFIDTDMTSQIPEKILSELIRQIPMQQLGKPEDVAEIVSFLISERARYMTGQVFAIDGGMTA